MQVDRVHVPSGTRNRPERVNRKRQAYKQFRRVHNTHYIMSAQGLHKNVSRQCGHAQALAHAWASCSRLFRVWQGVCRKFKAQKTPVSAYWRKAVSSTELS